MKKLGRTTLAMLLAFMMVMQLATSAIAYTVPTSDPETADDDSGIKLEQYSYDPATGILTMRVSGKMSSEMGYSSIGVLITFDNTKLTLNHRTSTNTYPGTEDTFVTSGIANTVNTLLYYGEDPEDDGGYYTSQTPAIYRSGDRTAYYVYHHSGGNTIGSLQQTDGWIPIFEFRLKVEGNPSTLSTVLDKNSIRFGDVSKDQTVMDGVFGAANEFSVTAIDTDNPANYRYFGLMSNSPTITSADTDKKFMPATVAYDGANTVLLGSLEISPATDAISVPTTGTSSTTVPVVTAKDTDGDSMTTPEITWSFSPTTAPTGVTYNSNGTITVDKTAQSSTVTVTASSGGIQISQEITITRAASVATSISITGDAVVTVPTSSNIQKTYTATVLDQYGDAFTGSVTWSAVTGTTTGVSFTGGILTVDSTAAASGAVSYEIKAVCGSAEATKTISVARETAAATTITVGDGQTDILVPADGAAANTSTAFSATVTDQYGAEISGQTIVWSIADAPTGVSINSNSGVVTVTNDAKATITNTTGTSYTVTATCGGVSGTKSITVKRDAPTATTVVIYNDDAFTSATGATDTLVIPTTSTETEKQYYAKLYDQYGADMAGSPTWSFATATAEVTHDGSGKVSVAQGATPNGTFTLTATISGKSASVEITVKDINVTWSAIVQGSDITYGDSKASAFTTLPTTGTATAVGSLDGTFAIVNPDEILTAGSKTITVKFTVTTAGAYAGVEITKDYTVTVNPKPITVTVTAANREYGAANPTFTAQVTTGSLVTGDNVAGLNLALKCDAATSTSAPGTYTVTGTTNGNPNYTVTIVGENKLTVTTAALRLADIPAGLGTVLANDTKNNNLAALTAAVQAANETLDAVYGTSDTTGQTLTATWTLKSGSFDRKGGTYTFEATLAPTNDTNFSYNGANAEVTVTVTPVTGTFTYSPTALTKSMAAIDSAGDMSDLGLPTQIAVTYDNSVGTQNHDITNWNLTLATLQAIDASAADVQRDLIPIVSFPAWATISTDLTTLKTVLTITGKYPVTVNVTPPADIAYGAALGSPSATQTAIADGTAADATWKFEYKLTSAADSTYTETKPTNAGAYTVRATLVCATHSGSNTATFTISKATYSEIITFTNDTVDYDGTGKTITATGMNAAVTASYLYKVSTADDSTYTTTQPINAGTYTVKASFTSPAIAAGNYEPIADKTATLTINKETPTITLTTVDTTLFGDNSTLTIVATENNTDAAGVLKYASNNTAAATVNSAGKVTAVSNGTAIITVSLDATANFNAASETFTVTAIPNPITGVSVTVNDGGAVTAAIVGRTIKVTGLSSDYTVVFTSYAGVTVDESEASNGIVTAKLTADQSVTQEYTVDISGVTAIPAYVTVDEVKADTNAGSHSDGDILDAALANAANTSSGLPAAIAGTIVQVGEQYKDTAVGNVEVVTYVKMEVVDYNAGTNLTLEIKPVYKVLDNDDGSELQGETPITSLNAPVTVTVVLPTGFPTIGLTILHNVNGTLVGVPFTYDALNNTVTFTVTSFSEFQILTDTRSVTATFTKDNGTVIVNTYTLADLGTPLPTDSKTDHTFDGWQISGTGTAYSGAMTQAMFTAFCNAGATISLSPKFTANSVVTPPSGGGGSTVYTITTKAGVGGKITDTVKNIQKGANVTISITPDVGYKVEDVLVDGVSIGAVTSYTFKDVSANHEIEVKFKKLDEHLCDKFTDIEGHWAHDAICYMVENGLMNGTSETTFAPDATVSRAMMVTILWRLEGEPDAGAASFTDVPAGQWYSKAIAWAAVNNIVSGYGNGTFGTNDPITREQMATILYRYCNFKGITLPVTRVSGSFTDSGSINSWAVEAVNIMYKAEILNGKGNSVFDPQGKSTRAEVTQMMMNFFEAIK